MKKIVLTLLLCSMIIVSGCGKKDEFNDVPKSIKIYQKINLTAEQNKKLADIRADQRNKIEAIRSDMEKKRNDLLDLEGKKNFTPDQKRENMDKYRAAANEMREKLAAERVAYDNAMMNILDDSQKKIYQKYLSQREKERVQREKKFEKLSK